MLVGPPYHYGRGGPGNWWILVEPGLLLADDVLVPDLAGWRQERMPEMPPEPYLLAAARLGAICAVGNSPKIHA
jgi:hypothetical protein